MLKTVDTFGCWHVVCERLSDGSRVYDVRLENSQLVINAEDEVAAYMIAQALHEHSTGVSGYDGEPE